MEIILWLQSHRSPFLDGFFKVVTFFGGELFYLLILPILYWGWRKRDGLWLGFVLFDLQGQLVLEHGQPFGRAAR